MDDYGPLAHVVATAGTVMAAGTAVLLAFRGRARWEPSEEDIANGPQRVGVLLTATAIVVLWSTYSGPAALPALRSLSVVLALVTAFSLLVYGLLVSMQTYEIVVSPSANATQVRNLIGGFWLTSEARRAKGQKKLTIQKLLAGAAYEPDVIWSRMSRGLAKVTFVFSYLLLTTCGAATLTALALIIDRP